MNNDVKFEFDLCPQILFYFISHVAANLGHFQRSIYFTADIFSCVTYCLEYDVGLFVPDCSNVGGGG